MKDYSIDAQWGTLLAIPLVGILGAFVAVPYWLIWQSNLVDEFFRSTSLPTLVVVLIVLTVAHEAVHGLSWMLSAGLTPKDIRYGVLWKALAPYAHPKVPISARDYRIGTAMPGVVIGALPAVAGVALQSPVLAGWGMVMLALAGGDLLILLAIRDVAPGALVRDHPSRFGCEVLGETNDDP